MHYISAMMFALSANMDNVAIGLAYGIKDVQIRFRSNLLIACLTSLGTLISMEAGATLTALLPEGLATNLGCGLLILMGLWFVVKSLHSRISAALRAHSGEEDEEVYDPFREEAEDVSFSGLESAALAGVPSGLTHTKSGCKVVISGAPEFLSGEALQTAAADAALIQAEAAMAQVPFTQAEAAMMRTRSAGCPDSPKEEFCESYVSWKESFFLALALMINNLGFGVGARIAGLPIAATSVCTFFFSMFLLSAGVYLGKHFSHTFVGRYTDLISGCIIIALGLYEFFI